MNAPLETTRGLPTAVPVVAYDFDGTLIEGDIGAAFVRHLLQGWRRWLALPLRPLGFLLMRTMEEIDSLATSFANSRPLRRREREIAWLESDLVAGSKVLVAKGAFETLARIALTRLGLAGRVVLVASRLKAARFSVGVERHCHGNAKLDARRNCHRVIGARLIDADAEESAARDSKPITRTSPDGDP